MAGKVGRERQGSTAWPGVGEDRLGATLADHFWQITQGLLKTKESFGFFSKEAVCPKFKV